MWKHMCYVEGICPGLVPIFSSCLLPAAPWLPLCCPEVYSSASLKLAPTVWAAHHPKIFRTQRACQAYPTVITEELSQLIVRVMALITSTHSHKHPLCLLFIHAHTGRFT